MIKRTITYENYDGVQVTEDFYFNFSKAELIMMQTSEDGGLDARLERIVNMKDGKNIMKTFRDILLSAYGEKSADGRRFVKSDELSKAFSETPAFDIIFEDLMNPDYALQFVNQLLPKEFQEEITKATMVKAETPELMVRRVDA